MIKNKIVKVLIPFVTIIILCVFISRLLVSSYKQTYWVKMFYWDSQANYYLVKEIPTISLEPQVVLDTIINDNDFIGKNLFSNADISISNNVANINIFSTLISSSSPPSDKIVADSLQSLAYTLCVNPDLKITKVQYLLDGSISPFIGPFATDTPYSLSQEWSNIYLR